MANYTLNYSGAEVDVLLEKIDTAFYETTVMGDTLTWDGDTSKAEPVDPLGNGVMLLYHVSDVAPTMSDFANGAIVGFGNNVKTQVASSAIVSLGDGVLTNSEFYFVISPADNITKVVPYGGMNITVTLPKKGVYFGMTVGSGYTNSLTINGYTGFEMTEVKPLNTKYIPAPELFDLTEVIASGADSNGRYTGDFNKLKKALESGQCPRLKGGRLTIDAGGKGTITAPLGTVNIFQVTCPEGYDPEGYFLFGNSIAYIRVGTKDISFSLVAVL